MISGQIGLSVHVPYHLLKAEENLDREPSLAM